MAAKDKLGGIVNNTNKQKGSEFLKLIKEQFKELNKFRKIDEDPLNEIYFQNPRLLGHNPVNSLFRTFQDFKVIDDGFQTSKFTLQLIFKGSRDGFKSYDFYRTCNNKSNILIVVESEHGSIFGGFTNNACLQNSGWRADDKAWIFSLTNRTVHRQY